MPSIEIVVAIARNYVIGKDKKIPWYLSDDLKHFKSVTVPHPIVMGRRTFESIGRALPQRRNVVITSSNLKVDGIETVSSLNEAFNLLKNSEKIMITGGYGVYKEALPFCNVLHLTRIDMGVQGDTYFPDFSHLNMRLENSTEHFSEALGCKYTFETWVR